MQTTPAEPRIRIVPEDFEVEEIARIEPSGEGEHAYLWIEKRLKNSEDVLQQLAAAAGCELWQVGYAGRKDRRAVTRQWFSVPGLDEVRARELELDGARVLRVERHRHKLRTGMLAGNRFRLRVRDVSPQVAAQASERLERLAEFGMPNRFGPQRFGRHGRNIRLGLGVLTGARQQRHKRTQWLMVSALQAAVFNRVLELRPAEPQEVLEGDVGIEHATGFEFWVVDLEREAARAERFEISATAPLFGFKARRPQGAIAKIERQAMEEFELPPLVKLTLPKGLRLPGERRPVRAKVSDHDIRYEAVERTLYLKFRLPPGSYATVVLEELLPGGYGEGPIDDPIAEVVEALDAAGKPGQDPAQAYPI